MAWEDQPLKAQEIQEFSDQIIAEVETVIVGKRETVQTSVLALLCNGHILIEDIPGVGKTTLAKALAKAKLRRLGPRPAAPSTRMRAKASIWPGSVPQQPPTQMQPADTSLAAYSPMCSTLLG